MPKRVKQDIYVTVVAVMDEGSDIIHITKSVIGVLKKNYTNYELIIVGDKRNMPSARGLDGLLSKYPCTRVVSLSSCDRYDTAIFAGLDLATGDYVCTMDMDIDPVKEIPAMVDLNMNHDLIQGVSSKKIVGRFGTNIGRRLFYWYTWKYLALESSPNATYFASYNRSSVNAIMQTKGRHGYIRQLAYYIGLSPVNYEYTPMQMPNKSRNLKTGVLEAFEIIVSYSTHPLRFVSWLGLFASVVNILYSFYIIIVNLTKPVAEGWTTTSLQLSAMFFVLFIILTVLSEYVGRILVESRQHPGYYISEERVSSIKLADINRRNIER